MCPSGDTAEEGVEAMWVGVPSPAGAKTELLVDRCAGHADEMSQSFPKNLSHKKLPTKQPSNQPTNQQNRLNENWGHLKKS